MDELLWTVGVVEADAKDQLRCAVYDDNAPEGERLPAVVYGATEQQCEKRARLVACAPALLALLQDAARALRIKGEGSSGLYRDMMEIIYKVEGE